MDNERRLARQTRRPGNIDLKQAIEQIGRNRDRASEIIHPTTFSGKLRAELVKRVPITALRNRLEEAPLTTAISEMRPHIFSLYTNMRDILREGKELTETHEEIRDMFEDAKNNPDNDELLRVLRDRLRHDAEKDLKIKRDTATEELLEEIFDPTDPVKKAAMREKTLSEAAEFLTISETIALVGDSVGRNTAQAYESLNVQYAALLRIQKMVEVLHRSGQDLVAAQDNRIQTYNTLIGQVDSLLFSASLANDVQTFAVEVKAGIDKAKIDDLQRRAIELNQRTAEALPNPTKKPDQLQSPSKPDNPLTNASQ